MEGITSILAKTAGFVSKLFSPTKDIGTNERQVRAEKRLQGPITTAYQIENCNNKVDNLRQDSQQKEANRETFSRYYQQKPSQKRSHSKLQATDRGANLDSPSETKRRRFTNVTDTGIEFSDHANFGHLTPEERFNTLNRSNLRHFSTKTHRYRSQYIEQQTTVAPNSLTSTHTKSPIYRNSLSIRPVLRDQSNQKLSDALQVAYDYSSVKYALTKVNIF